MFSEVAADSLFPLRLSPYAKLALKSKEVQR